MVSFLFPSTTTLREISGKMEWLEILALGQMTSIWTDGRRIQPTMMFNGSKIK